MVKLSIGAGAFLLRRVFSMSLGSSARCERFEFCCEARDCSPAPLVGKAGTIPSPSTTNLLWLRMVASMSCGPFCEPSLRSFQALCRRLEAIFLRPVAIPAAGSQGLRQVVPGVEKDLGLSRELEGQYMVRQSRNRRHIRWQRPSI